MFKGRKRKHTRRIYLLKIARTKISSWSHWCYDATNWICSSMGLFVIYLFRHFYLLCNSHLFLVFGCYFCPTFYTKAEKASKVLWQREKERERKCVSVESGNGPCTKWTGKRSARRCWIWDISIETITELQPQINYIIRSMASAICHSLNVRSCGGHSCQKRIRRI